MTTRHPLSLSTKLFYGLGSVAFGVKDNGFGFFLLIYYNQVLGLPESWVGLGIMLALFADAVFDPIVGRASDHLHSRWGRRHPFMYASAIPVGCAYFFLWDPPAGLSTHQLFAYLLVVAILVRVLIACYEIPSSALAAELTEEYDERTSVMSFRFFFGWWGGLTMAMLAYAVFLVPDAGHPTGVLNPAGYHHYGVAAGCIMAAAILTSAAGTHSHIPFLKKPPTKGHGGLRQTFAELRQTLSNRPFRMLFGAAMFSGMAAGISAALTLYFNTFFWELSSMQMLLLAALNFVSAAIALVAAPALSRHMGKKPAAIRTWLAATVVGPLHIALRLVGWFPGNGSPWLMPVLGLHGTVLITLFIMSSILVTSMIADVVEDSEVTTGRRDEGVFFAANAFVQKAVSGVGIFGSTVLLAAIGFPSGATPGSVDPEIVRRLGLVYIPTVGLLYGMGLLFLSAYGISREKHEANLERLGRGPKRPG